MPEFYFDIETTGINPASDSIVTIQWHDLSTRNYADVMPRILCAWDTSEREILRTFLVWSRFFTEPWNFIPVGFNLDFEMRFIFIRAKAHGLIPPEAKFEELAAAKPRKDLKHIVVLMNGGSFKGASLENFSAKPSSGHEVIQALQEGNHDKIFDYIQKEMWGFIRLYARLETDLPRYWRESLGPHMKEQKEFLESVEPARRVPVAAVNKEETTRSKDNPTSA